VKYAWIEQHKKVWPVTLSCEVLEVSTSGYFQSLQKRSSLKKPPAHGSAAASVRVSDVSLLAHIRSIHAEVKGEYGWPKMWCELQARGIQVISAN
jgi:putative transposase